MPQDISFDLTGQVMIVTGAGKGIGKAIAETAARFGADVALGSRTVAECEATAEVCRGLGRNAYAAHLDVASLDSIHAFTAGAVDHFGRIDSLVNNAGYNVPKPALEYSEEEFDQISDINFKGAYFMSAAVAGHLIEAGRSGSVITISSQVGVVGGPLRSIYAAAKGAVGQFTRSLALEWAANDITVNAVAPTFTRTPLLEASMAKSPEFAKNLERVPMGRIAEPEEIAGAVVFLASSAARMVTGQVLCVDGGYTAI